MRDRFGDEARDKLFEVDAMLGGLSREMKAEAYGVLTIAMDAQHQRDSVRAAAKTEADMVRQVESVRDRLSEFVLACFYDWEWPSQEVIDAASLVLDLIQRDWASRPQPSDQTAAAEDDIGPRPGKGGPPKPEVRRADEALNAIGVRSRIVRRQLLGTIGVISELPRPRLRRRPRPPRS